MSNNMEGRKKRHRRVRKRVQGTPDRPRLCVFRSIAHMYAQVIDDSAGRVLASASSLKLADVGKAETEAKQSRRIAVAHAVGRALAEQAREQGITRVSFDRGGYRYHGRVAALAAGAREGGLEF